LLRAETKQIWSQYLGIASWSNAKGCWSVCTLWVFCGLTYWRCRWHLYWLNVLHGMVSPLSKTIITLHSVCCVTAVIYAYHIHETYFAVRFWPTVYMTRNVLGNNCYYVYVSQMLKKLKPHFDLTTVQNIIRSVTVDSFLHHHGHLL